MSSKRKREDSPVSTPTQCSRESIKPLTRRNLRILENMASSKGRGKKIARSETSPSDSVAGQSSNASKSTPFIRALLRKNKMYIDDEDVYEENLDFLDHVRRIVLADRPDPMTPASCEKIRREVRDLAAANEETVIENTNHMIMKAWRMTSKDAYGQVLADGAVREWKEDHLAVNKNALFVRGMVPIQNKKDELAISQELKKSELPNRKPDFVYGLKSRAFDKPHKEVNEKYCDWAGVATGLWHPFLLAEWKSSQGDMEHAENQVCRGAATVVHANRLLREKANNNQEILGPDKDSFIFSATHGPDTAKIWVHWALVRRGAVDYHMHEISYNVKTQHEGAAAIRKHLYNILDWGVLERPKSLRILLDTLFNQDRVDVVHGKVSVGVSSDVSHKRGANGSPI